MDVHGTAMGVPCEYELTMECHATLTMEWTRECHMGMQCNVHEFAVRLPWDYHVTSLYFIVLSWRITYELPIAVP